MNLIYSPSYASARDFALHHDLAAGDWKWINDTDAIRHYPRADVFKAPRWHAHPHRAEIDEALQLAQQRRRLGTLTDCSASASTLGVSGG